MSNNPHPNRFVLQRADMGLVYLPVHQQAELLLLMRLRPEWANFAVKNKLGCWYFAHHEPVFKPEINAWIATGEPAALYYSGLNVSTERNGCRKDLESIQPEFSLIEFQNRRG